MWMERGRGGTCGKKKGSNMATSIISHRAGTVMSLYLLVLCEPTSEIWSQPSLLVLTIFLH